MAKTNQYFWQMLEVHFPEPDFQIRNAAGTDEIFDALRRKWVVLTPEEWVRQNMVRWLTHVQGIPGALIGIEKALPVGDKLRRFDILVFNRRHQPWLLVECKAMEVPLSGKVLQQALSMFSVVPARLVAITNGHHTYAWQSGDTGYQPLEQLPPLEA
jgi:hypothetical protein